MKRATLKDLAKALNTTIATVSRALHDHPEISDKMKERVREVARLYDYKPNTTALSLKYQRSHRLGVIFPRLAHYYVTQVITGMLQAASESGYKLLIAESSYKPEKELEYIREFYELNVDGILILPSRKLNLHKEELEKLINPEIPFLVMDRHIEFEKLKVPTMLSNDHIGTREGITHLIEQGYKKIAHLRGLPSSSLANARHDAYRDTLLELGVEYNPEWVVSCHKFTIKEGERLATELMAKETKPDAIFCINDIVAVGALNAVQKLGYKVPDEVGILGFSDSDLAEVTSPTMSSVHQPGVRIGKKSINLILSNVNDGKDISHKNIVMKTRLVKRNSTQRGI